MTFARDEQVAFMHATWSDMVQLVIQTGSFYGASLYVQLLSVTYIFRDRHLCGDDWAAHVAVRATSTW